MCLGSANVKLLFFPPFSYVHTLNPISCYCKGELIFTELVSALLQCFITQKKKIILFCIVLVTKLLNYLYLVVTRNNI